MNKIVVNVVMVTYNQDKYISQAIESALEQKCDFKFRIIISDDCSTDTTADICYSYQEKYPDKILFRRNKSNLGLVRNYQKAFSLCTAKYIAILEGDDYWTDTYKLNKQVDILEKDDQVGLVNTNCHREYENGELKNTITQIKAESGYVFDTLIKRNFISSVTVCFRKALFDKHIDFDEYVKYEPATIDYSLWTEISYYSKVIYLEESTAVYRVLSNSISNTNVFEKREHYINRGRVIKKYIARKYASEILTEKKIDNIYDLALVNVAIKLNEYSCANKYLRILSKTSLKYKILAKLLEQKLIFHLFHKLFNKVKRAS